MNIFKRIKEFILADVHINVYLLPGFVGAKYPEKKSKEASGFDVYLADIDPHVHTLTIGPGETLLLHTGLSFDIPNEWEIQVRPRSGFSKKGLKVDFGTVDSDYTGELGVTMYNATTEPQKLMIGETRIAQIIVAKKYKCAFKESDISNRTKTTERGSGGFGSTGK